MTERIGLQAVLEDADFQKGLSNYMGGLDRMGKQTEATAKSGSGHFANLGQSVLGVGKVLGGLALGAAVAGVAALAGVLVASTKAAMEAETVQADLNATLASTKGAAGLSALEINNMALALSRVTPFEDDAIVKGQAMLLTFTGIGRDVFPMATEAMLNMSQKMGTDLSQSAVQLGKALNDPIAGVTALRKVGVQLTDAQEESIKKFMAVGDIASAQKIILGELETEFGGLAVAAGTTLAGQMTILQNEMGNVQEEIGAALIPILASLAQTLGPILIAAAQGLAEFITTTIVPVLASLGTFITTNIVPAIETLALIFSQLFSGTPSDFPWEDVLPPWLADVAYTISDALEWFIGVIGDVFAGASNDLPAVQGIFEDVFRAVQVAADSVIAVLGYTVDAFGVVVGWVQDNWPRIQAIFEEVFGAVLEVVNAVVGEISSFIVDTLYEVLAWVDDNWPLIQQTIETVLNAILAVVETILGAVRDFWQEHGDAIMRIVGLAWDSIKTVISTALDVIFSVIKAIMQAINGDWDGAWETIKGVANRVWEAIKTIVGNAIEAVRIVLAKVLGAASTSWSDIWEAMQRKLVETWNTIKLAVGMALDAVKQYLKEKMQEAWQDWLDKLNLFVKTVTDKWAEIKTMFANKLEEVKAAVSNFDLSGAGRNLVQGLINGMNALVDAAVRAAQELIRRIKETIQQAAGMFSPSTMMAELGENLVAGMAMGITESSPQAINAMAGLMDGIAEVASEIGQSSGISVGSDLMQGVATGVIAAEPRTADITANAIDHMGQAAMEQAQRTNITAIGGMIMNTIGAGITGGAVVAANLMANAMNSIADAAAAGAEKIRQATSSPLPPAEGGTTGGGFSGSLGKAISDLLESIAGLGKLEEIKQFGTKVALFQDYAVQILTSLRDAAYTLGYGEGYAVKFAEAAGAVGKALDDAVSGFLALGTWVHIHNLTDKLNDFQNQALNIMGHLREAGQIFVTGYQQALDFGQSAGAVGKVLDEAISGFQALGAWVHIHDLTATLKDFQNQALAIMGYIRQAGQIFVSGYARAVDFAEAAGAVGKGLTNALAGFAAVGAWQHIHNLTATLKDFQNQALAIMGYLREAGQIFIAGYQYATDFATSAGVVGKALTGAVTGFASIGAWVHIQDLTAKLTDFQNQALAIVGYMRGAGQIFKSGYEQAVDFATSAGAIGKVLGAAVSGFAALGTWKHIHDLTAKLDDFQNQALNILGHLREAGQIFKSGYQHAIDFANTAGAVGKAIGGAVTGFASLAKFESILDLADRIDRFAETCSTVLGHLRKAGRAFGDGLEIAEDFAKTAGAVGSAIGNAIKGLVALAEWDMVAIGADRAAFFAIQIQRVVQYIWAASTAFTAEGLAAAKAFAEAAGAVVGVIGPAINGLKAMLEYQSSLYLPYLAASLARDVAIVIDQFMAMGALFITEGLTAATEFAQAAGAVMGVIKTSVEGMAELLKYTGGLWTAQAWRFAEDVRKVVEAFEGAAARITTDGLKAAVTFATSAGQVFSFIKGALGTLADLSKYSSPTAEKTAKFLEDVKKVVALVAEAVEAMFAVDQTGRFAVVNLYLRGQNAMIQWLRGMVDGVSSGAPSVIAAVRALINQVVSVAESGLGVSSPSEVFTDIGAQTVQGLIEGILARAREALDAMHDLIERIAGDNVQDYYQAGQDSALEWLRGWAEAMRAAALAVVIPAGTWGDPGALLTAPGGSRVTAPANAGTAGGVTNNYYITAVYSQVESEARLYDTVRLLQLGGV